MGNYVATDELGNIYFNVREAGDELLNGVIDTIQEELASRKVDRLTQVANSLIALMEQYKTMGGTIFYRSCGADFTRLPHARVDLDGDLILQED